MERPQLDKFGGPNRPNREMTEIEIPQPACIDAGLGWASQAIESLSSLGTRTSQSLAFADRASTEQSDGDGVFVSEHDAVHGAHGFHAACGYARIKGMSHI